MKVKDYITSVCWCGRVEVEIPVSWVTEGLTNSCSNRGCGPGCEMVADTDDEDPYDEPPHEKKVYKMSKFNPSQYNPLDDSTEGLPRRADCVSLLVGPGLCGCGCGDAVSGAKANFCMGHDARLKGKLTRAAAAGCQIALVDNATGVASLKTAIEYASTFSTPKVDWAVLVQAGADKIIARRGTIDRRAAERRVLERAARDGAVRTGRWDKTGSVAAIYKTDDGFEVEYVDEQGRVRQTVVA